MSLALILCTQNRLHLFGEKNHWTPVIKKLFANVLHL